MNYETLLITGLACLILGGILGYLLGDYHHWLLMQVKKLTKQLDEQPEPVSPTPPTVTMGAYDTPRALGNTGDKDKAFGIIETKTPELLEWEQREATKKQVLGQ